MSPNTSMIPAAIATPLPFASDCAFSAISVFASSISSRTSSDAFVETSLTTSPSDFSAVLPLSVIAATDRLQELREDEAADKRRDHRDLRASDDIRRLMGRPRRLTRARAVALRSGGCAGLAGFHHSGGSSSNSFTHIAV